MVGKIRKRSDAAHLINYLLQDKQQAKILAAEGVSTITRQGMAECFDMHIEELGKQNIKHPFGHIALSWSPEDRPNLDDEIMRQVAEEYLREMEIVDTPYIVVQHNCTEHPHLHIMFSRVGYDGKVIKTSADFRRNAKVCRMLTEKYGFKLGKSCKRQVFRNLKGTDLEMQRIRQTAFRELDKSNSWEDFRNRMSGHGINLSFRTSEDRSDIVGIIFGNGKISVPGARLSDGLSFRNIDDLFGGELQQAVLDTARAVNESAVIAFDKAMELVAQPQVTETSYGGGSSSSDTETEDEKKRRLQESEEAQGKHSQQAQQTTKAKPTFRRRR